MFRIKIIFEQPEFSVVTLENIEPGQTLLEVCLKNDIELHHNCGGVCACSTCHLLVQKGEEHLEPVSKKEKDFIERAIDPGPNSRLGCQCLLINRKGYVEIIIPNQSRLNEDHKKKKN